LNEARGKYQSPYGCTGLDVGDARISARVVTATGPACGTAATSKAATEMAYHISSDAPKVSNDRGEANATNKLPPW